jgi:anaerobic selenocysteine-containing dehydrogenase
MSENSRRRIPAFCALCVSRCGCEAVVDDGRLVAIEPDPLHPTGKSLCAKGRASPELVYAEDRLLSPLRRSCVRRVVTQFEMRDASRRPLRALSLS